MAFPCGVLGEPNLREVYVDESVPLNYCGTAQQAQVNIDRDADPFCATFYGSLIWTNYHYMNLIQPYSYYSRGS